MKFRLIFIFFIINYVQINAQTSTFAKIEEQSSTEGNEMSLGQQPRTIIYKQRYLEYVRKEDAIEVIEFNKQGLVQKNKLNYNHSSKKGKLLMEELLEVSGRLWLITRDEIKLEKRFDFYIQQVDDNGFELIDDPILIGSMGYLRSGKHEFMNIHESENHEHVSVSYNVVDPTGGFGYVLRQYTPMFDLVDEYELENLTVDKERLLPLVEVKNDGTIAVLDGYKTGKKDRKSNPELFQFVYFMWLFEGGEVNRVTLNTENLQLIKFSTIMSQDKLIVAGTYLAEEVDKKFDQGYFIGHYDFLNEEWQLNSHSYVFNDISIYMDKSRKEYYLKKYKKSGILPFYLKYHGIKEENGAIYILLQRHRYPEYPYPESKPSELLFLQAYIVIKFKDLLDETPELTYSPCSSHYINHGGGTIWFCKKGNVYILFNQLTDNLSSAPQLDKAPKNMELGSLDVSFCIAKIDFSNQVQIQEIGNRSNFDIGRCVIGYSVINDISYNSMLVVLRKKHTMYSYKRFMKYYTLDIPD